MTKLNCLFLEDNDSDYETFWQTFKRALHPAELTFKRCHNATEACNILEDRAKDFQIFFADLLMPDPAPTDPLAESEEGLTAVDVASNYNHVVIIGISKAEGSRPGIRREFEKRGGHLFLDKRLLKGKFSISEIKAEIEPVLRDRGYFIWGDEPSLKWIKEVDIRLDAEIEEIEESNLMGVIRQIAPSASEFIPHYVAPGFSGAVVLRFDSLDKNGHAMERLLVKLSREAKKLIDELKGSPGTADLSANIYVPYLQAGPWHHNGWFAIAAQFDEDSITLQEWVTNNHSSGRDIKDILDELFNRGLRKTYVEGEFLEAQTALDSLYPKLRTRIRAIKSNELLQRLISELGVAFDLTLVDNFLKYNGQLDIHPANAFPNGTYECLSHGDLHSKNILITIPHARPRLIDTGSRRKCHWACDPARFCVDHWISIWDFGAKSYFWEDVVNWQQQFRFWLESSGAVSPVGDSNQRMFEAVVWMRDNLQNIFMKSGSYTFPKWEFDLALVHELLNISVYPDVPAPKRCFALLAANDILIRLQTEIPWK